MPPNKSNTYPDIKTVADKNSHQDRHPSPQTATLGHKRLKNDQLNSFNEPEISDRSNLIQDPQLTGF